MQAIRYTFLKDKLKEIQTHLNTVSRLRSQVPNYVAGLQIYSLHRNVSSLPRPLGTVARMRGAIDLGARDPFSSKQHI